ncbi:MAG: hypothetical protein KDH96_01195 [Candidatus Riesia sp.]|uniref:Uncharacterized protein n=1 Tax=Candidatus Dojkabacteria bacterium TaxID=2099670 RepID=A0A955RIN4_9BACT|nr:hypothetical protein [Candidatus Dojkabacteria bacterium]MCB1711131.1 hypothetical protein [Candidatus Riesia sp.]
MSQELVKNYAILRRITGLNTVSSYKARPGKFKIGRKDFKADGVSDGDFRQNVVPGVVTGLAPYWNEIKDTYWPEDEDIKILHEIQSKLKVRYPKDHPESPGSIIKSEDIDPRNFWDYFFQSDKLKEREMVSGSYLLNLDDPLDRLLFFSYKNNPRVLVRDGREVSKYTVGAALFELVLPENEILEEKESIKKEMDAFLLLSKMSFEKKKTVARIMKLPLDSYDNPSPDNLDLEIGKAAKGIKRGKQDNKNIVEFIEIASLNNEDLAIMEDITKAKDLRIIVRNRGEFFMNSEKLLGVESENAIFSFFKSKSEKNQEMYSDMLFLIKEKEKLAV